MTAIRFILRGLSWLLGLFLAALILWVCWSLLAYRDIPASELEAIYGGEDLQYLEHDGTRLRYRVAGEGPNLLLIHSHYFNMRMWEDWLPTLTEHFRVIRFDLTSHGLTGRDSRDDYSMERDLDHIEALLEELQVEEFAVLGSSLGGNMAFYLAQRHPERITHLVLANSGGIPRPGSRGTQGTIPGWVDYVSYLMPTRAFRSFLEWMIVDDSLVTDAQVEEFHRMFRREGNRFAEFNRLRSFEVGDPTDALASIQVPVLLMWGEDNPQLPVAQVDRFLELLVNAPRIDVEIYPGVGHVIPLEIPAAGSDRVRDFLLRPSS